MSIARWMTAVAVVAGTACTSKPGTDGTGTGTTTTTTTSTAAPCTVIDSVSGTTVPCYSADSVSGTTARVASKVSVVFSSGGGTVPLSALSAACRDVSTGARVNCTLGIMLGAATTPTGTAAAESVSGTTGRDSTK